MSSSLKKPRNFSESGRARMLCAYNHNRAFGTAVWIKTASANLSEQETLTQEAQDLATSIRILAEKLTVLIHNRRVDPDGKIVEFRA